MYSPVRQRSQLRDEVAATIRETIVAGRVRPGELLRLGPLAELMDVSITPVREALLLLAQDGWVTQEHNRGFRVAPIRRKDVEDTYFVHELLAGELAARAARHYAAHPEPAAIAAMRALHDAIGRLGDNDGAEAERLNYELHQAIYQLADAPRLEWFVEAASRFVPRRFWITIPGWSELNRTGHLPIVEMIEQGNPDVARALMSSHIHQARKLLLDWLDSISFWEENI